MFEEWDAVTLARAQFAFTMSFHIVFPAFSIGLASYLAVLEARWLLPACTRNGADAFADLERIAGRSSGILRGPGPCPLLALSRHHDRVEPRPLSGVKRTSVGLSRMSAYDPKRT